MTKGPSACDLAVDLLDRSTCAVQCAAVLVDTSGRIHSWGHNHVGFNGLGQHAEAEAIRRANKRRLFGSIMCVAGRRQRNGKAVPARPCPKCQKLLLKHGIIAYWRDQNGAWRVD